MSIITGDLFRPFLGIQKDILYNYANKNAIIYREDMSNTDMLFERNHIRKMIMPMLQKINPTISETLGELGEYMQELSYYIEKQIVNWLVKNANISEKEHSFFRQNFLNEPLFFQREIIAYLYSHTNNNSTQ